MIALGVQADNVLYEAVWTEDTGWGDWQAITLELWLRRHGDRLDDDGSGVRSAGSGRVRRPGA